MHIADKYCQLPFRAGGRDINGVDCWGLVRLFIWREAGLLLPSYDGCDTIATTIAHEKRQFVLVDKGKERRFDVAICGELIKSDGKWTTAPIHTGVFVDPGLLLHITKGSHARIDPIKSKDLKIIEIRRVLA